MEETTSEGPAMIVPSPVCGSARPAAQPHLRLVPGRPGPGGAGDQADPADPADRRHDPDGPGPGPRVLHKVRVRLPDEPGALARLTEAVARADGNILGLAVHGQDSRSVVDEMFVGSARGADELAREIREGLGAHDPGAVLVTPADPHDLVDAPTRALDLAVRAVGAAASGDDTALVRGLAALVHADDVRLRAGAPPRHPHVLAVPAPYGGWLVARRDWAPFTVTERARAEAFLRAADRDPGRPRWDIVLLSGAELTAEPATGDEVAAVEALLCDCLAVLEAGEVQAAGWRDSDLRALLVTSRGPAILVRDEAGVLVALGAVLDGETVLLVHPHLRGLRLGRWLRRRLAARSALPV